MKKDLRQLLAKITYANVVRYIRRRLNFFLDYLRYHNDITLYPPPGYNIPGYNRNRAKEVYGPAFRIMFEYLINTGPNGCILEFGTYCGFTARLFAKFIREFKLQTNLYLFDSFEGLPEIISDVDKFSYEVIEKKVWTKGSMSTDKGVDELIRKSLSKIIPESSIKIIKGFFEDTLDEHLPSEKAALVHIDCDLYSSARFVLEKLIERDLLQDGGLLVFDDFNSNRANPVMGERKALQDVFSKQERYICTPFFGYGWHAQVFFIHDQKIHERD